MGDPLKGCPPCYVPNLEALGTHCAPFVEVLVLVSEPHQIMRPNLDQSRIMTESAEECSLTTRDGRQNWMRNRVLWCGVVQFRP